MQARRDLNYFTHPGFLSFDTEKGVLRSRGGTRLVGVNEDWLRGYLVALDHEAGAAAPLILRRCGGFFGNRLARRLEAELTQHAQMALRDRPMMELDALFRDAFRAFGLGRLEFDWSTGGSGFVSVWCKGAMSSRLKMGSHRTDALMEGTLEGLFRHFASDDMEAMQTMDERDAGERGASYLVGRSSVLQMARGHLEAGARHDELIGVLSA